MLPCFTLAAKLFKENSLRGGIATAHTGLRMQVFTLPPGFSRPSKSILKHE